MGTFLATKLPVSENVEGFQRDDFDPGGSLPEGSSV
jgi:hypothetical protein